jgi:hypothetical protein
MAPAFVRAGVCAWDEPETGWRMPARRETGARPVVGGGERPDDLRAGRRVFFS